MEKFSLPDLSFGMIFSAVAFFASMVALWKSHRVRRDAIAEEPWGKKKHRDLLDEFQQK